jgi:His-Xaa-Ser system protein HxsD
MQADFVFDDCGLLLLRIDLAVYSLDALLKTAYWYTNRCFLHLQLAAPGQVEVRFKAKPDKDLNNVPEAFMNDLLDQSLREKIAHQTEPFRNLIVAHALSKTCLINSDLESTDPFDNGAKES